MNKHIEISINQNGQRFNLVFAGPYTEDGFADFFVELVQMLVAIGFITPEKKELTDEEWLKKLIESNDSPAKG